MRNRMVVLSILLLTQSGCNVLGEYADEIYRTFPSRLRINTARPWRSSQD
jgi:hypothetical protein